MEVGEEVPEEFELRLRGSSSPNSSLRQVFPTILVLFPGIRVISSVLSSRAEIPQLERWAHHARVENIYSRARESRSTSGGKGATEGAFYHIFREFGSTAPALDD